MKDSVKGDQDREPRGVHVGARAVGIHSSVLLTNQSLMAASQTCIEATVCSSSTSIPSKSKIEVCGFLQDGKPKIILHHTAALL